jgi:mono/diheme cytochrome c family protein
VQGDTRLVGPSLAGLDARAANQKPGTSAEDYIRESIRDPNARIVSGFPGPPSLMPPYGPNQISDADMANLIAYLRSLR